MFEIKAIIPKSSLNADLLLKAVNDGLDLAAIKVQEEFGRTIETWAKKPEFPITTPAPFQRLIATSDVVYGWVNNGTAPHEILPKPERRPWGRLRYTQPYSPATRPRRIASFEIGEGDEVIFSKGVHHPGVQPRELDATIAEGWNAGGRLAKLIQAQIDQVVP